MFFFCKRLHHNFILCPSSSFGSLLNSVEINLFPQKWFHLIEIHFILIPTTNKTYVLDQKQILIDNRYGHEIIKLVAIAKIIFFCIRTDQKSYWYRSTNSKIFSSTFVKKKKRIYRIDSDYIAPYKHIGRVDEKKNETVKFIQVYLKAVMCSCCQFEKVVANNFI